MTAEQAVRDLSDLRAAIEELAAAGPQSDRARAREVFARLRRQLSEGVVRAAEPGKVQEEKRFEKEITVKVKMNYLLFLPAGYE